MTLIGSIVVGVSANTEKLQKGLSQGRSALASFGAAISGPATAGLSALATGLGTIAGGVSAAGGAFLRFTAGAAEALDQLGATAQQLGIASGALRDLQAAAAVSDTGMETVSKGLRKMESAVIKAAHSAKDDNPFEMIGLSARELSGMAPELAFEQIAKAIADLPSPMERTAAAMSIFGKSGAELIPLLMEVAGGAGSLRERMGALGSEFSESGVQGVKAAKDAYDTFKQSLSFVFEIAAMKLAPAMQLLIEKFQGFLESRSGQEEMLNFFQLAADGLELMVRGFDESIRAMRMMLAGADNLEATYRGLLSLNPFASDEEKSSHRAAAMTAQIRAYRGAAQAEKEYREHVAENGKRLDEIYRENAARARELAEERKTAGEVEPTEKKKVKSASGDRLAKAFGEGAKLFEDALTPAEKYERQIKRLHGLFSLGAISQQTWGRSMVKARKDFEDETAKGTKKQRDEAEKLTESLRTPLEEYQDEVARVKKLQSGGFIDAETARRGVAAAGEKLHKDTKNEGLASNIDPNSAEGFRLIVGGGRGPAVEQLREQKSTNRLLSEIKQVLGRSEDKGNTVEAI